VAGGQQGARGGAQARAHSAENTKHLTGLLQWESQNSAGGWSGEIRLFGCWQLSE
jgi:hypothetical protein